VVHRERDGVYMPPSRNSEGDGAGSGIAAGLIGDAGTGDRDSSCLWNGLRVWMREMGDAR